MAADTVAATVVVMVEAITKEATAVAIIAAAGITVENATACAIVLAI